MRQKLHGMLRRPSGIDFADSNENKRLAEKCLADLQAVIHAIKVGPRQLDAVHFVMSVAWVEQIPQLITAGLHRCDRGIGGLDCFGFVEACHADTREIHRDTQAPEGGS
jgi:hypothetical protein